MATEPSGQDGDAQRVLQPGLGRRRRRGSRSRTGPCPRRSSRSTVAGVVDRPACAAPTSRSRRPRCCRRRPRRGRRTGRTRPRGRAPSSRPSSPLPATMATPPVRGSKLKIWCVPAMATTTAFSLRDHTTSHGELSETSRGSLPSGSVKPAPSSSTRAARFPAAAGRRCRRGCSALPVGQGQAAEAVVDGVGDDDVVAHLRCHVGRQQDQALGFVELCGGVVPGGRTVGVALGAGAEGAPGQCRSPCRVPRGGGGRCR